MAGRSPQGGAPTTSFRTVRHTCTPPSQWDYSMDNNAIVWYGAARKTRSFLQISRTPCCRGCGCSWAPTWSRPSYFYPPNSSVLWAIYIHIGYCFLLYCWLFNPLSFLYQQLFFARQAFHCSLPCLQSPKLYISATHLCSSLFVRFPSLQ